MNKLVHIGHDKFSLTCNNCKSDKVEVELFHFHDRSIKMNVHCTDCNDATKDLNVVLPFYNCTSDQVDSIIEHEKTLGRIFRGEEK